MTDVMQDVLKEVLSIFSGAMSNDMSLMYSDGFRNGIRVGFGAADKAMNKELEEVKEAKSMLEEVFKLKMENYIDEVKENYRLRDTLAIATKALEKTSCECLYSTTAESSSLHIQCFRCEGLAKINQTEGGKNEKK